MKDVRLNASTVKYWFQYRCDRRLAYDATPQAVREAIPIVPLLTKGPWADFGVAFENRVVTALEASRTVLRPPPGEDALSDERTMAFLRGGLPHSAAAQLVLKETPALRKALALPEPVRINSGRPDLVLVEEVNGRRTFTIVDVKATQAATIFHRAQVAFYAIVLEAMLAQHGIDAAVAPKAAIWHVPAPGRDAVYAPDEFVLKSYVEAVRDFFARDVPRVARYEVSAQRDDTFFHVYFKCEQCPYLPHCAKSVFHDDPARRDVSAIPGLTQESKRILLRRDIRTVGQYAGSSGADGDGWALATRGEQLRRRAQAQVDRTWSLAPDRVTWLMPPEADLAIHLVADRDPADGVLVTLGCRIEQAGRPAETTVEVMRGGAEGSALRAVLGKVVEALAAADAHNGAGGQPPLRAHLFVYEPSEARDLQEALGRHLGDAEVRRGLLDLVRMFPPEDLPVPEPGYRTTHHLPATAVRSVVEQLLVLPVIVSYDLVSVTRALRDDGLAPAYEPDEEFAHRFSSRLSVDLTQKVLRGEMEKVVGADVERRLEALSATVRWLWACNAKAPAPFLRLEKQPFRFQRQFDPLSSTALEVLRAQTLLQARGERLATLSELARPSSERIARFRCRGPLKLVGEAGAQWGRKLTLAVEGEPVECEVGPGTFAAILTDDDPALRLDASRWRDLKVRIDEDDGSHVVVFVPTETFDSLGFSQVYERLRSGRAGYLDPIDSDLNVERLDDFLASLSE